MRVEKFADIVGDGFFTGVPDSTLKALGDYLISAYGVNNPQHIIAANEGNAVALAAGYYLATGKVGTVYLQNSGIGNIVNPVASLLNAEVYGIPCLFVIGWRGEPGIKDEPQHVFQGKITEKLLQVLDMDVFIMDASTTATALREKINQWHELFAAGKQAAVLVRKNALTYDKIKYTNDFSLRREEVIREILAHSHHDFLVATTGKAGRELFELREELKQGHDHDFLTVGSMGHASSIALSLALNKPQKRIWCLDGDGALLMHAGALATVAACRPQNLVHVVINNEAHESVGGQPTAAHMADLSKLALGAGYGEAVCVEELDELRQVLAKAKNFVGTLFIEVKTAIGARENLGRPTTIPAEIAQAFGHEIRKK